MDISLVLESGRMCKVLGKWIGKTISKKIGRPITVNLDRLQVETSSDGNHYITANAEIVISEENLELLCEDILDTD